jgi:hypothetical protein
MRNIFQWRSSGSPTEEMDELGRIAIGGAVDGGTVDGGAEGIGVGVPGNEGGAGGTVGAWSEDEAAEAVGGWTLIVMFLASATGVAGTGGSWTAGVAGSLGAVVLLLEVTLDVVDCESVPLPLGELELELEPDSEALVPLVVLPRPSSGRMRGRKPGATGPGNVGWKPGTPMLMGTGGGIPTIGGPPMGNAVPGGW